MRIPPGTSYEFQEHLLPDAVLGLFYQTAGQAPAYRSFLSEHGIKVEDINTFEDFQRVPLMTKENYIQRYPLAQLCRGGRIDSCDMIAVSSGSTGQPTFWPRSTFDEEHIADRFRQVFRDSFVADTRRTLAVVCFALGTWVGGMYTATCCRYLADTYPITIITPGNNKEEIFRVVEALGPQFEQVVLLGYPPFLKDVIDRGRARGMDWAPLNIKLVMAGEVFSEEWRSLMAERTGCTNICYGSASLYGTADAGVLGNETPLSICIRRYLATHPEVARELFGESRLPTLVQYDPLSRYFEVHDGTLLFSGNNGIPLVRYHINDNGGLISYEGMLAFLERHGFDPIVELQQVEKPWLRVARRTPELPRGIHRLPFVWVFGRSHFTVSYFGANIYPENVTVGLEQDPIKEWVTGKFVLQALEDDDRDRYLSVTVELAPGIEADEAKRDTIADSVLAHLLRLNSEFANYTPREYQRPRIELKPFGDPEYFPTGVKHRYTRQ